MDQVSPWLSLNQMITSSEAIQKSEESKEVQIFINVYFSNQEYRTMVVERNLSTTTVKDLALTTKRWLNEKLNINVNRIRFLFNNSYVYEDRPNSGEKTLKEIGVQSESTLRAFQY